MPYRIRRHDGRWLSKCEVTAWPRDRAIGAHEGVPKIEQWTVVPFWHDERAVTFSTRQEAETLTAMLRERGFLCDVVEE